ncbi:hypothetical protein V1477_014437 [Vespula maculifrons]|uniref:Uncharacterized protein n=1 Tax=Vespula maculifrons TaxID=7453 RepID=A0ABD2BLM0_VESMC
MHKESKDRGGTTAYTFVLNATPSAVLRMPTVRVKRHFFSLHNLKWRIYSELVFIDTLFCHVKLL